MKFRFGNAFILLSFKAGNISVKEMRV